MGDPPSLLIDLATGIALCAIVLARLLLGEELSDFGWHILAVAGLACASLVLRHRAPLIALVLAVICGVLAMPVNLNTSPIDAIVGVGLIAATIVRASRTTDRRWSAGWLTADRDWPGPRWWRVPAIMAVAVGAVVVAPVDLKEAPAIALLLSAYAVGLTTGRSMVLIAGGAAAGILAVGGTLIAPGVWTGPNTPVPLVAMALIGAAVGDAVRSRRDLFLASQERTRRMEQALEEEARRRVVEERLRIAREVHDLVAHHIAVVNMQAGVASHHIHDRPEEAAEALGHVRAASRTVLGELGTLLSVLRDADDPADPIEPAPRLAELEKLLDSFAAAGLRIEKQISGEPQSLSPSIDLTAYRIIQECLTNARKHGDGSAEMSLTYTPDTLQIVTRNPCPNGEPTAAESGTGHGMMGMRERLAAVGGSLSAGRSENGAFVMTARLPLSTERTSETEKQERQ